MLAIATTDHEFHHDRAERIDAVPRVLDHPTAGTPLRTVGESLNHLGTIEHVVGNLDTARRRTVIRLLMGAVLLGAGVVVILVAG